MKKIYLVVLLLLLASCQGVKEVDKDEVKKQPIITTDNTPRQELSKSHDWLEAWNTCKGYVALKKDGSLWQFGKVGGCEWTQIHMSNEKKRYVHHLQAKKIADGFGGAKIINGGYRVYAIKKDGTLWGFGEGLGYLPRQIGEENDWKSFAVEFEGNGCCAFDIGLKKDGTLFEFPEFFDFSKKKSIPALKVVVKEHKWEKIVIDCCSLYGQKKDKSFWLSGFNEETNQTVFNKLSEKDELFTSEISNYKELVSQMNKLKSREIKSFDTGEPAIKAKKDGTLWLKPELIYGY